MSGEVLRRFRCLIAPKRSHGPQSSQLLPRLLMDSGRIRRIRPPRVVVEFSSPNVAKPFHVGHLRSTLLGAFISRLLPFAKTKVIRLNWLGDWGTQFGLLGANWTQQSPMTLSDLFNSYVEANKKAESDPEFYESAKRWFHRLESGDPEARKFWLECCAVSRREFDKIDCRTSSISEPD